MSDTEVTKAKATFDDKVRQNKIDGMRELLDLLEAQPIIPIPSFFEVNVWIHKDGASISDLARALKPVNKKSLGSNYILERVFNDNISLHVNFDREEVCERVVVRTEEVPAQLVEAYTREVVEWKCPESIMDHDDSDDEDDVADEDTNDAINNDEEATDADTEN